MEAVGDTRRIRAWAERLGIVVVHTGTGMCFSLFDFKGTLADWIPVVRQRCIVEILSASRDLGTVGVVLNTGVGIGQSVERGVGAIHIYTQTFESLYTVVLALLAVSDEKFLYIIGKAGSFTFFLLIFFFS